MATAFDPDQGYLFRIKCLQFFTVANRYQPVSCTMNDVGMATYIFNPFICTQVKPQNKPNREHGQEPFDGFGKTEIGCVQYQVSGFVVAGNLGSKPASKASSVDNDVLLCIPGSQVVIYKLHIA